MNPFLNMNMDKNKNSGVNDIYKRFNPLKPKTDKYFRPNFDNKPK